MSTVSQRSFAGGEISPSLYARVDVVKYSTGLRTCRNFFVKRSGGVDSRCGTEYICEVKDSSKRVRLLPFIFNSDQTYVLEFGDQYVRFIRNGVQIESSPGVPYEIASPYLEAHLQELNIVQSADVVVITHQNYPVYELKRTGHTSWTLTVVTFAPSISAPTGLAVSGASGTAEYWVVTTIKDETYEESLPTAEVGASSTATSGSPRTLTWTAVAGAGEYNIYKKLNGIYGFIGVAGGTSFVDDGIPPDTTDTPPQARNPFAAAGDYPATAAYYQQRLAFANTINSPEETWMSKSGFFRNFTVSAPLQDDDAVTFKMSGRRVNQIRQIVDLGAMILLTSEAEWLAQGDSAGIIRPGEINLKTQSYNGSSTLKPILINDNALYVQARGTVVRDLFATIEATGNIGYKGTDLTIFASHLFEIYGITDWDYCQIPNSLVWCIRADGALIGFTYLREHQIWAWHRHDTDGLFENVCAIPEGIEDSPYFVVKRTINGVSRRYIERMPSRTIDDVVDFIGMDSALTYDGRNTGITTMTLNGSGWTYADTLTLNCSTSFFSASDVGNQIVLTDASTGDIIRCTITAFTNTQIVSVRPNRNVPVSLQGVSTTNWSKAIDEISGLDHLEGKRVSVLGDGYVVANPNNSAFTEITVFNGAISLDKPYSVIHVGLPFFPDLETLDIDSSQGETLADKKKLVSNVTIFINKSRGIWVGSRPPTDDSVNPIEGLEEYKARNEENYDDPIALRNDQIEIKNRPEWNANGRVFVRQIDPLPLTVLAVMPAGLFPFTRGA